MASLPNSLVAIPSFRKRSRADAQRRLSLAMALSLAIHASALFAVGAHWLVREASSPTGWGAVALQAVLQQAEAKPDLDPAPVMTVEASEAPKMPLVVERVLEPEPPGPVSPAQTAPAPGPAIAPGTPDPPLSVTVGAIADPARFGTRYANTLAQLFPDPVMRTPQLKSSLVLAYPREAVEMRTRARIAAFLTIDERGEIVSETLVPDEGVFGPAIRDALKNARFVPADMDNQPVRYWVILEFVFSIEGGRTEVSALAPPPVHALAKAARPAKRR